MLQVELVIELVILAILLVLGILGFLAVRNYRGRDDDDTREAYGQLAKFREMHLQGDLSDAEFRTLKTVINDSHCLKRASFCTPLANGFSSYVSDPIFESPFCSPLT